MLSLPFDGLRSCPLISSPFGLDLCFPYPFHILAFCHLHTKLSTKTLNTAILIMAEPVNQQSTQAVTEQQTAYEARKSLYMAAVRSVGFPEQSVDPFVRGMFGHNIS